VPIVTALGVWGARWANRELADHEVDASLLLWALERGGRSDAFGDRRAIVKLSFSDQPMRRRHFWYLIEEGTTQLCVSNPGFEVDLYVTTTLPDMIYIWRGDLPLARAQNEGRFEVLGDAWARRAFPQWLARSGFAHIKSQRASKSAKSPTTVRPKALRADRVPA